MVKNKFLLLIAAVVWLIAGYNVLRIGWIAYINYIKPFDILISVVIFCLFWFLVFHKLVLKHTKRIQSFLEPKQYAWKFFDRKSFFIMFFYDYLWYSNSKLSTLTGGDYCDFLLWFGCGIIFSGYSVFPQLFGRNERGGLISIHRNIRENDDVKLCIF